MAGKSVDLTLTRERRHCGIQNTNKSPQSKHLPPTDGEAEAREGKGLAKSTGQGVADPPGILTPSLPKASCPLSLSVKWVIAPTFSLWGGGGEEMSPQNATHFSGGREGWRSPACLEGHTASPELVSSPFFSQLESRLGIPTCLLTWPQSDPYCVAPLSHSGPCPICLDHQHQP